MYTLFRRARPKNHTLSCGTYPYNPNKGVPLPPGEILDFATRDYPEYAWRLNFFGIKYIRYETNIEEVTKAVREELEGPGQYLGYRAMQRKLREQHKLAVPRNLVYVVMSLVDPERLKKRGKKTRRGATGTFISPVMCLMMRIVK